MTIGYLDPRGVGRRETWRVAALCQSKVLLYGMSGRGELSAGDTFRVARAVGQRCKRPGAPRPCRSHGSLAGSSSVELLRVPRRVRWHIWSRAFVPGWMPGCCS